MAKTLTPIDVPGGDTPLDLVTLANAIVNTIATEVVTANSDANGALTIGNSYVSGVLGASVIAAGELRGGTVATPDYVLVSSNLVATNASVTIKMGTTSINSSVINASSLVVNAAAIEYFTLDNMTLGNTEYTSLTFNANSSPDQVFDFFAKSAYRSAEYLLQMTDTSPAANAYQVMKFLVVHDGTSAFITQYGIVTSNGEIATINASANSTSILITVSPVSATNVELIATRTMMGI